MATMGKRNSNIDAIRGIACIFVVLVHCVLPGEFGQYMIAYARFAVPFFVLVSGWFAYHEDRHKVHGYCLRKLKDTCKLTVSAALLYFLWNSLNNYFSSGDAIGWLISYFSNGDSWYNLIVYNRAVFLNSVMYYLLMMIYVYIIIIAATEMRLLNLLKWFIPVGLVWNYVLGAVVRAPWFHSGNFLLTALPFFLLGMQLRRWSRTHSFKPALLYGMLSVGLLLTYIEASCFGDVYCYVGSILISISVLLLCTTDAGLKMPDWMATFGRNYSTYIFILHCGLRDTLKLVIKDSSTELYQWISPWAAIALAVVIAIVCRGISRKLKK